MSITTGIADGLYRAQIERDAVFVTVRIWFGAPICPHSGVPLDRSPRRQIEINGETFAFDPQDMPRLHWRSLSPIDQATYDYMTAMRIHAVRYEPSLPQANPRHPVDFRSIKFNFGGQS